MHRSLLPLCAWLVLIVSAVVLFASSARHKMNPGTDAVPSSNTRSGTHSLANAFAHAVSGNYGWGATRAKVSPEALNQDSSSTTSTAAGRPNLSGWSFQGIQQWWLQRVIEAKRSWSDNSYSDSAPPGQLDKAAKDPPPPAGTFSSPVSGASGGGTAGGSGASGSGSGTGSSIATGSGTGSSAATISSGGGQGIGGGTGTGSSSSGGSATGGSTGTPASSVGGSGTGSTTVPISAGSGSGSGGAGSGTIAGATSGSGYGGTTSSGSPTGTAVPPPPPPPPPQVTRDPALWPFNATSPWNYPIGSNAQYAAFQWGSGPGPTSLKTHWANAAVYIGANSDPIRNLTIQTPNGLIVQYHIPLGATPSGHGDNGLQVIRADHLAAWEGEAVSPDGSGGFVQPSGTGAAEVNLKGDGWGLPGRGLFPGGVGVGTASSTPYLAGLIRRGELNSGIPHAIRVAVYESLLNLNAPGGNQQVWPATAVDGNANTGYLGQVRNLYMGSLIALPSNVTISSLNLATTQGANVARALQQYGGYITITLNGSGGDAFLEVENPNDDWSSMPAAFLNDLNIIAAQLRIVSNSNHNGGQPQNGYKIDGGDGTVGPLAPAFR